MYSQETVLELLEIIYASAGDPAQWAVLLKRLAAIMKGNIATIHYQNTASLESDFAADWNMDPSAIAAYTAYYGPLNVWFTSREGLNTQGNVYTSQMLCPDDSLIRTEFYNDWLRPQDMHQGAGATILKTGSLSSILSVFRSKSAAGYGEKELDLLRMLMPHLQRAFQLHHRIQGLETKGNAVAEVLEHLPNALLMLDAGGRVLMANRAATTIFAGEKGLRLTPKGLVAASPSENGMLTSLIQGAIHRGTGEGMQSGGAMAISRGPLRRPLQILVIPLRTKTIQLGKGVPIIAVFISDPDRTPRSHVQVFAQIYGLTQAEARLAEILASGKSLKDAAKQLGVAQSTVRSQLKSTFAKTNTSRQSQLVRLLLITPGTMAQAI